MKSKQPTTLWVVGFLFGFLILIGQFLSTNIYHYAVRKMRTEGGAGFVSLQSRHEKIQQEQTCFYNHGLSVPMQTAPPDVPTLKIPEQKLSKSFNLKNIMDDPVNYFLTALTVDRTSNHTRRAYENCLLQIQSLIKPTTLEKITMEEVDKVKGFLRTQGLVSRSINMYLQALRQFLLFCRERKMETTLAPTEIKRLKMAQKIMPQLTAQKMKEVLQHVSSISVRDFCIFICLYSTGLRINELMSLPADLKLDENGAYQVTGKGGKTRTVYFSQEARLAINAWNEEKRKTGLEKYPTLFPFSQGYIQSMVKYWFRQCGLDEDYLSCHSIRKLFATTLANKNVPLQTIRDMLGHVNVATTSTYLQSTKREQLQAHKQLPKILD